MTPAEPKMTRSQRVRSKALRVASDLFYANGVRAVGMDQIVDTSGIAKTTIYRHFPTKDMLIEAFLQAEDAEFWHQWDQTVSGADAGIGELEALCRWIGDRVRRDGYRGCPQINVAAEFADYDHPARAVARAHKAEMLRRLTSICARTGVSNPSVPALQISLLLDGAFMSDGRLNGVDAPAVLIQAVRRIVTSG